MPRALGARRNARACSALGPLGFRACSALCSGRGFKPRRRSSLRGASRPSPVRPLVRAPTFKSVAPGAGHRRHCASAFLSRTRRAARPHASRVSSGRDALLINRLGRGRRARAVLACVHTCMCACVRMFTRTHVYAFLHVCLHTCVCGRVRACARACMCTPCPHALTATEGQWAEAMAGPPGGGSADCPLPALPPSHPLLEGSGKALSYSVALL